MKVLRYTTITTFVLLFVNFSLPAQSLREFAAEARGTLYQGERILTKPKPGIDPAQMQAFHATQPVALEKTFPEIENLQILKVTSPNDYEQILREYNASGLVEYAEPDFIVHAFVTPNDARFTNQWNLHNTGQSGGVADADIDAPEGWDIQNIANTVIVAVTDTGIRLDHEDLAENLWTNPGEIAGNGIDDDSNGYIDDIHGINAILNTGNPSDDNGHGTHVSGILGARGNNAKGIAGVAWQTKIMALKFLPQIGGTNDIANAIECLDYARAKGAHIVNASWGFYEYSQALYDAINSLRTAGIILVAAAGNDKDNTDLHFCFPAAYNLDNIVSVCATTRSDALAFFSNFAYLAVDLGAPGLDIESSYFESANSYATLSGTSMAAPHVSGALALTKARLPSEYHLTLIYRMLGTVDFLSGLKDQCSSGGRLNLQKLLQSTLGSPANDNFANRIVVGGEKVTAYGVNINATKETGEPNHAGNAGGKSVWWSWTAPFSGQVELTTAKSAQSSALNLNTLLAVYTGSSVNALTLIASNDDSGLVDDGTTTSRLTFNAVVGTTYQLAVDGFNGVSGGIKLSLHYAPKNDNFASSYKLNGSAIACDGLNSGGTKEGSEPNHAGNAGGRSVWWSWKAPANGTFILTTAGSNFDTLLAVYTGSGFPLTLVQSNDDDPSTKLRDEYGGKTSSVTFTASEGQTYHIAVDGKGGAFGNIFLAGGFEYSINAISLIGCLSDAQEVNSAGYVVGHRSLRAYLLSSNLIDLGTLGGNRSWAEGLNKDSLVVGRSEDLSGTERAFIWDQANGMRRLDSSIYSSAALAINDLGTPVGYIRVNLCDSVRLASACYWTNNNYFLLPFSGGLDSFARDINKLGEAVGTGWYKKPAECDLSYKHAQLWQLAASPISVTDLGTLGGTDSEAWAISEGGQIVGNSRLTSDGTAHAAMWSDGRIEDVGTLGTGNSRADGINNRRQFVGRSLTSVAFRAFLGQNGVLIDLNRLIPPQQLPNGWEALVRAWDINDKGKIVGVGQYDDGSSCRLNDSAFILTPLTTILLESAQLLADNRFQFTISGPNGLACTVQAATTLLNPNWTDIGTVTLSNGSVVFTDQNAPSYTNRFYRVKSQSASTLSVNVVAYLIRPLPQGKSMVCNPFEAVDNRVAALFAGVPEGFIVYKWNDETDAYRVNIFDLGSWTDNQMTLNPGEGVTIESPSALTQKLVGEVSQNLVRSALPSGFAIRSSHTSVGGAIDAVLNYPAFNGDKIHKMIDTQGNTTVYTYQNGTWTPSVPTINLGEAFWSERGSPTIWRQNLSAW